MLSVQGIHAGQAHVYGESLPGRRRPALTAAGAASQSRLQLPAGGMSSRSASSASLDDGVVADSLADMLAPTSPSAARPQSAVPAAPRMGDDARVVASQQTARQTLRAAQDEAEDSGLASSPSMLDSTVFGTVDELLQSMAQQQATAGAADAATVPQEPAGQRRRVAGSAARSVSPVPSEAVPDSSSSTSSGAEILPGTSAADLAQLLAQLHSLQLQPGSGSAAPQPSEVAQQAQTIAALQAGMSRAQRRALRQMTQAPGSQVIHCVWDITPWQ